MDVCFRSYPGGRPINEDRAAYHCTGDSFFAAVADGLGGHDCGDIAAETAIFCIQTLLPECAPQREALRSLIDTVNQQLLNTCTGKTTLALVYGQGESCFAVHTGDSRIYQFRGNEIIFQTRDHSVSQLAVAVGEISPDQLRSHPDRNKLIRCLGSPDGGIPEIHPLELRPGDGLLLCSDGFWELILEDEMLEHFIHADSPQTWLETMLELVFSRTDAHSDNLTGLCLID